MKLRLGVLFFLVLSSVQVVSGQQAADSIYQRLVKFPLATVNYYNFSGARFDNGSQYAANIDLDFVNATLQFAIPIKEKKLYLFNGLEYGYALYRLEPKNGDKRSEDFHSIRYNIGLITVLPGRKTLAINVIPIMASDFHRASSNALQFNAAALLNKRKSPNFEYGVGIAFTSYVARFESPLVVPLISMVYKHGKHTTKMVLPSFLSYSYALNESMELMLEFRVMGGLYDMAYPRNSSPYDLNGFSETKFLLGPKVRRRLMGDLYFSVEGGIVLGNNVAVQDNHRQNEIQIQADERFFMKVGLAVLK